MSTASEAFNGRDCWPGIAPRRPLSGRAMVVYKWRWWNIEGDLPDV